MVNFENIKNKEDFEIFRSRLKSEIAKLNNEQLARKVLMNSEYGSLANRYFRYYDIKLASAITLSGQWAIRWIENYLMAHPLQNKYKWKVIYSDTDSIYMLIDYIAKKISKKYSDINETIDKINEFSNKIIQPIIDQGYQKLKILCNANENRMFMKQEKLSIKALWTGKKKYALYVYDNEGVRYKEPKLKVKGIETVRSSTPKFVREKLKDVLKIILMSPDKLSAHIEKTKEEFFALQPEDIAFTVSVNKLQKYSAVVRCPFSGETELSYLKGTPIGVRSAIVHNRHIIKNDLYNQYLEIKPGDKIQYLYLKLPNPVHENVIGFISVIPEKDKFLPFIDYETQFYKSFLKPIENITKRINMLLETETTLDVNDLLNEILEGEIDHD